MQLGALMHATMCWFVRLTMTGSILGANFVIFLHLNFSHHGFPAGGRRYKLPYMTD